MNENKHQLHERLLDTFSKNLEVVGGLVPYERLSVSIRYRQFLGEQLTDEVWYRLTESERRKFGRRLEEVGTIMSRALASLALTPSRMNILIPEMPWVMEQLFSIPLAELMPHDLVYSAKSLSKRNISKDKAGTVTSK